MDKKVEKDIKGGEVVDFCFKDDRYNFVAIKGKSGDIYQIQCISYPPHGSKLILLNKDGKRVGR